jgi:DNA-binding transcriptional ArsR family regulator
MVITMVLKQKPRISKRLERLVKSSICPAEDVTKYASELRQLIHGITDENTLNTQSRLFKALADKTRLKILMLLDMREMCVCEIMVALNLTQPTASHHLGILEAVELIKDRREGKWIFYSLKNKRIMKLLKELMKKAD